MLSIQSVYEKLLNTTKDADDEDEEQGEERIILGDVDDFSVKKFRKSKKNCKVKGKGKAFDFSVIIKYLIVKSTYFWTVIFLTSNTPCLLMRSVVTSRSTIWSIINILWWSQLVTRAAIDKIWKHANKRVVAKIRYLTLNSNFRLHFYYFNFLLLLKVQRKTGPLALSIRRLQWSILKKRT